MTTDYEDRRIRAGLDGHPDDIGLPNGPLHFVSANQAVAQYTADENALIAETLGHLISLMEGLCEQVTVDRLRALRTKAASLAFNEIAGT